MPESKKTAYDAIEAQPLKIEGEEAAPPSLGRRLAFVLAAAVVVAGGVYYTSSAAGVALTTQLEDHTGMKYNEDLGFWYTDPVEPEVPAPTDTGMKHNKELDFYYTDPVETEVPAPTDVPAPAPATDEPAPAPAPVDPAPAPAPVVPAPAPAPAPAPVDPAPAPAPAPLPWAPVCAAWDCPCTEAEAEKNYQACKRDCEGKGCCNSCVKYDCCGKGSWMCEVDYWTDVADHVTKCTTDGKHWKKHVKKSGGKKSTQCFPAAATVQLENGATKSMQDLQLGDAVLDASGAYSPVYFFSHADASVKAAYVELSLEGGSKLSLTPDHYVAANGHVVYAKDVAIGDAIDYVDAGVTKSGAVVKTSEVLERGLYNPYTLSGTIVVDGVVASCHSSWILDGLLPPHVAAVVYQRLFVIPRLAYKLLGPDKMDAVFSVGNTGSTASITEQTAMLFGVCALTLAVAVAGAKAAVRAY